MFGAIIAASLATPVKARLCARQPFPFMHLLFMCTSLTRVRLSYLSSSTHDHRREAKVTAKRLPVLRMSVVSVMWKENVFFFSGCSIFIVPLNKHMGRDELVSIRPGAPGEHIAGGPITAQPITRVSVRTGGSPSGGTHDTHAYGTCSASCKTPHTNTHFMEDRAAADGWRI